MNSKIECKSAILREQRKGLEIANINISKIPSNYVLLKMIYSGICHTQINEINGILGKDKFLPLVGLKRRQVVELEKVKNTKIRYRCCKLGKKPGKKYEPLSFKYKMKINFMDVILSQYT